MKDKRVDAWSFHPFSHPSRTDNLKLSHWIKLREKNDSYPFAKFNKHIEVIQYTEDEYKQMLSLNVEDPRKVKWSKTDTDLLF